MSNLADGELSITWDDGEPPESEDDDEESEDESEDEEDQSELENQLVRGQQLLQNTDIDLDSDSS